MNVIRHSIIFLVLLFFPLSYAFAEGGVLYVTPERGSYAIGDTFEAQILADTGGEAINAAEAELSFNTTSLSVQGISTEGSILQSWSTEPTFSNETGTIKFAGWTKENYTGKGGLLLKITFKALRNSASSARLAAGAILAADGSGSNIITSMRSAAFAIKPKEIVPEVPATPTETATSSSDAPPAPEPPKQPVFAAYDKTIMVGAHITATGSTSPRAKVLISIQHGEDPEVHTIVESDDAGDFAFTSDEKAEEGVYRLWAQAEDASGTHSVPSSKIRITAEPSASLTFLNLVTTALPYLAFLLLGALIAGYFLHRRSRV